jgi:hypothetical protein
VRSCTDSSNIPGLLALSIFLKKGQKNKKKDDKNHFQKKGKREKTKKNRGRLREGKNLDDS